MAKIYGKRRSGPQRIHHYIEVITWGWLRFYPLFHQKPKIFKAAIFQLGWGSDKSGRGTKFSLESEDSFLKSLVLFFLKSPTFHLEIEMEILYPKRENSFLIFFCNFFLDKSEAQE